MHSPASLRHEVLGLFVGSLLREHVARQRLGRVFGPDALMQLGDQRFSPDCSVLLSAIADRATHDRVVGPLDLLVEITSPSKRKHDHDNKLPAYREGQVGEIWLIDAERRQFEVHALTARGYETKVLPTGRWTSIAVAGLVVDVDWFWREPLPSLAECQP
ncbi:MAG: Uma2 family endonuclease [Phycisphaerae bacterium]